MLEMTYEQVDPATSKSKIAEHKKSLEDLYKDYHAKSLASSSCVSTTSTPHDLVSESPLEDDFDIVSTFYIILFHLEILEFYNHYLVIANLMCIIIIQDLLKLEKSIEVGVGNTKTKNHLEIYFDEPRLERRSYPKLDVLSYWKDNKEQLGDLALMVCDILTIPITTVASESAFSIEARVLTPYRNRLYSFMHSQLATWFCRI